MSGSFRRVDNNYTPRSILGVQVQIYPLGYHRKGREHVSSYEVPDLWEDDVGGLRPARVFGTRVGARVAVVQWQPHAR